MQLIDLTLPIKHGVTGHPKPPYRDRPTKVEFVAASTQDDLLRLRERGFHVATDAITGYPFPVTQFTLIAHPFTHIDTPLHIDIEGRGTEALDLEATCGEAVVLDLGHKKPGESINAADLEAAGGDVDSEVIPIIHTGWTDRAWGTPEFYTRGIYFDYDAADWFLERGVRAIALDCLPEVNVYDPNLRIDPSRLLHKRLLGGGLYIISNLTNLHKLPSRRVTLLALPLRIVGADAAPARVVAMSRI